MIEIDEFGKAELFKCAQSFEYFCETYLKLVHPKHGLVPFKLYPYQKQVIELLRENRFVVGLKFRQGGFSSLMVAWYLWRCMFQFDESNMILCNYDREAISKNHIARTFIEHLPDWLKPKLSKHNDHLMIFEETGCKLFFRTPEAACGRSIQNLYIDEAAYIPDLDKHWKAMWPVLSNGGHCCVISSANGTGNWFHEVYTGAEKEGPWSKLKAFSVCDPDQHPDNDGPEWSENLKKNLGELGWQSEMLGDFTPTKEKKMKKLAEELGGINLSPESQDKVLKMIRDSTPLRSVEDYRILADTKPTFIQWPAGVKKGINPEFWKELEESNRIPTVHPEFDTESEWISREWLAEFWVQAAELHPEFEGYAESAADFLAEREFKEEQMMDKLADYIDTIGIGEDALVLAGLCEKVPDKQPESPITAKLEILENINRGQFSDNMKLTFNNEYLTVNGLPTKVTTQSVKWAYMGLAALRSHEEAVEEISGLLRNKLQELF